MNIVVNGKEQTIERTVNINQLLEILGYQSRFVAVAKNQSCIPKSSYEVTLVHESDEIEILAPMSGG